MAEKDVTATPLQDSYTAKDLAVLEGLDAVRKRPGMYIGSTDSRGLMHCLWEIIDNSVDESLAGHCKKIEINLESDGSVEVHDDGRGIPVDKEQKTGLTGVEVVLTKLHAGGKFGGGSYAASGGQLVLKLFSQNCMLVENLVAVHMQPPVVSTVWAHLLLTHLLHALMLKLIAMAKFIGCHSNAELQVFLMAMAPRHLLNQNQVCELLERFHPR